MWNFRICVPRIEDLVLDSISLICKETQKCQNAKIPKFEHFIFSNPQKSGLDFYLAFDKSILSLYPHTRSSPAHLPDNFKRVYIPFLGN